jgi:hypothetical protein
MPTSRPSKPDKVAELAELLKRSQRLRKEAARLLLASAALGPLIEQAQNDWKALERRRGSSRSK